jgi:hypothetical protein
MKAGSKVDQRVAGVPDSGTARSKRLRIRLIAVIASVLAASALSAGTAQAATVTVFPNNPEVASNCIPFGRGVIWPPFAAFFYQNVPSFELKTGDTLAFDLGAENDADIELDIALARTVSNGTIVEGEPFKQVISNNQTPANPRGDTTVGNFELRFTAEAPFSFPGGGLIIRFSDPSTSFAADTTCNTVLNSASSTDTSGFFVQRTFLDPDGVFPWTFNSPENIGAFRVVTTDPTPPEPPPNPQPPPAPPPGTPPPEALTLDLGAKKQELRKKIKFFATASAASTLVATGKKIKDTTKPLAADQKTNVKAKLKRKARNRLEEKLEKKGKAKVKVTGTASDQTGTAATDTVKVKLKD